MSDRSRLLAGDTSVAQCEAGQFSREDTKKVKGLAICLMLVHHLFAFPDRINSELMPIGLLSVFGGGYLYEYFAQYGKICVSIFLFLSGFGLMRAHSGKENSSSEWMIGTIKRLFISYWKVFFLFIPLGFLLFGNQGQYAANAQICNAYSEFNGRQFLSNLLGITYEYNWEWWFFGAYITSIITFPLFDAVFKRLKGFWQGILVVVAASLLSGEIFPAIGNMPLLNSLGGNLLYDRLLCQPMPYVALFWLGMLFGAEARLERFGGALDAQGLLSPFACVVLILITVPLRVTFLGAWSDLLTVPVVVVCCSRLLRGGGVVSKAAAELGACSSTMWLTHSFLCYYFGAVQALVLLPRYVVLVAPWFILLSYLTARLVDKFWESVSISFKTRSSRFFA